MNILDTAIFFTINQQKISDCLPEDTKRKMANIESISKVIGTDQWLSCRQRRIHIETRVFELR